MALPAVSRRPVNRGAVKTELAEKSLRHFVRQAWHVVEPATEYRHNWHIDALCDHLEATIDGRIRNLLITMPPRAMKSLTISVFFPAWAWINRPELRFLYASYAQALSTEHSQLTRMVIESEWYQERWGDRFQLADDDNLKTRFSNTKRGYRIATSVGAAVTGFGGDVVIADDPHNVQEAESEAVRKSAVDWWNRAMSTRLNNPSTGSRIVVMQRVHETDVAGTVKATGRYEHLNLPMEYEPDTARRTGIGWTDPRSIPGELLWPQHMDTAFVADKKLDLGSYAYAAQFQQRPAPAEGGMFKRHWWRFWQPRGENLPPVDVRLPDGTIDHRYAIELPPWWDMAAQSWDMTFKETKSGSFVVGLVAGINGPNGYLLDHYRSRVEFTEAVRAVRQMTASWPGVGAKLIEDKANGPAVISELRSTVNGLLPVRVQGSKQARAHASTPRVEAGNWFLPHPKMPGYEWVEVFIDELAKFPNAANDDQVDAFSQVDHYLMGGYDEELTEPESELAAYLRSQ